MSSLKMTFSLTSLILIFAMLVAPTVVMAHDTTPATEHTHPTVSNIALDSATTTQTLAATVFRITFSEAVAVDSFDTTLNLTFNLRDGRSGSDGLILAAPGTEAIGTGTAVSPTTGVTADKVMATAFTFTVNVGALSGYTNAARQILLKAPADLVDKRTFDALGAATDTGSLESDIFTIDLPPVEATNSVTVGVAQKVDSNDDPVMDTYTLTLTFVDGSDNAADPTPDPKLYDVVVMPMGAATPIDSTGVAITDVTTDLSQATDGDGIFTQDYQVSASLTATEVSFGLLSSYIDSEAVSIGVTPPTPASEPDFGTQTIADIEIWKDQEYNSHTATGAYLPLAHDVFGETLSYSFDPVLPTGLEPRAIDAQSRFIQGTPTMATMKADGTAGAADYEYIVTNSTGGTDSIEFTINVKDPVKPGKPTAVMADEAARGILPPSPTANTVTVTWMAPSTDSAMDYGSKITSYTVSWTQVDMSGEAVTDGETGTAMVDANEDETMAAHTHTTGMLPIGIYQFEVQAVNGVEASDKSEKTDDSEVIVANPPAKPADLRAAKVANTITLSWNTPLVGRDPNAPITGHTVYITDPDDEETTEDSDATDVTEHAIEAELENGRYVFRVAAVNLDGESERSIGTAFEVDLTKPDDTKAAPEFAADATIPRLDAVQKQQIEGRILPEATDDDTAAADLIYSISPTLPKGLNFDAKTRALTGTPEGEMAEKVYTYKVMDGTGTDARSDTIPFFISVKATTPATPPPSAATTVADKGYVVYVRDLDNAPDFGTATVALAEWSAMPNLYTFFTQNEGGSLQLNVAGITDARKVIMTEVMWAVDNRKKGQDSYHGNQWIEVYNQSGATINVSDISFMTKQGRPALAQGSDLISNVVGGGSAWIQTKGQNGDSGAADGSGMVEFISMYRNKRDGDGWNGGHWSASTQVYRPNYKGTPGSGEAKGPKTFAESSVKLSTVFNEISNSSNSDHEWIELRVKSEDPHFENWVVDMVTGASDRDVTTTLPTQARLFKMPKLDTGRFDKILLITKTDPQRDEDHPLRGGYNVEKDIASQDNEGRDKNIRYYVADDWTTDLPDDGEFVLILRHGNDKTNHEKVEDLAGYHPNLKVDKTDFFSNLWPLQGYPAPDIALNKIEVGKVHRRQKDNIAGTRTADKKDNADHVALRDADWTGIGYKRNADAGAKNGGTPGYANNALAAKDTAASGDPVIISEIMYGTGRNIPQWIELRNTSKTVGVNLDGWQLSIVNHDKDIDADGMMVTYAGDLSKDYAISGKIPPGEAFLIVAHSGTDNTNLPSDRIEPIRKRGELILSGYGFEITLKTAEKDGARTEADKVGNLAEVAAGAGRVRGNPQSYEDPAWTLPMGMNDDGDRVSIVRRGDDGQAKKAWVSFELSAHASARESTYYGNRNDRSNPGYTIGGALPVSLSKFRPERMKDTGEIVIRWVTESELNNAGFNILRGEALDGEFTQVHFEAGHGTTSERNTYEWSDKSAKPNVVYYYQIQDVSLDGEVTPLRTTHLRGNVTAVGKLTTTWGEIKALQ